MTMIKLFRPRVAQNGNSEFSTWSDVLDRFFENDNRLDFGYHSSPKTNIVEKEDHYRIDMYVPGVAKSDLKVEVENDLLTISKSVKQDKEDANYLVYEFGDQTFERRFSLPDDVNTENVKADYVNGILSVTLWKKEEAKTIKKEISIN